MQERESSGGRRGRKRRRAGFGVWLYRLVILLLIIIGPGTLSYPLLSTWWNDYRNKQLLTDYSKTVSNLEPENYDKIWQAALAYNAQHRMNVPTDAFDKDKEKYILKNPYADLLNPNGDGIMGYVEIPKIDITLPIYHGTGPEALEKGCGHLQGTSLPTGGVGNHTVLSAHRGLPSAKLFTDLDHVKVKDHFFLHILGKTLAYEVDQIETVLPEESEALAIDPKQDYATLITCTPYAVNTHRLLVRGHRVEYVPEAETETEGTVLDRFENSGMTEKIFLAGVAALLVIIVVMLLIYALSVRRAKKAKKRRLKEGN